ncbi:hypothetical protein ABK040_001507 [Willaertia magna]
MSHILVAGSSSRFLGLIPPKPNVFSYNFDSHLITDLTKNQQIKKIISGGAYKYIYNCIWTEDDKIYFYPLENNYNMPVLISNNSKYFTTITEDKYEINLKQVILDLSDDNDDDDYNEFRMKDIFGNAVGLFFWMKNGNLFNLNFNLGFKQVKTLQSKIITRFGTGIMSDRYCIKNDKCESFLCGESKDLKEIKIENQDPIFFGCYNTETDIIITKENKLFKKSNDVFHYKSSLFEKESKVVDLKCGYRHSVILLENQSIYAFGFNSLYQCGVFNYTSGENIDEPTKLTIPLKLPILSIQCTSRGTCIVCKDEIIFIGEVVESEINKTKRISTSNLEDNNYFNAVACGPWHYIVYKKNEKISKSLEYFTNNLGKRNVKLTDVVVYFE